MSFFYHQLFTKLPYPTHDYTNQTIIVTGSNIGLGLEAARHFTRLNASKVILAVRNLDKGSAAKKSIEETTARSNVVEVWELNLSRFDSVKQFAAKAQSLERVDVLVENAGIAPGMKFSMVEDNEASITVNVTSTFLLALLMIPKLRETAKRHRTLPHLVIVSSEVHGFTDLPERKEPKILEALADEKKANMGDRYNVSKLLEVFFVREIAGLLNDNSKPQIVMNYLTPGLCHSELGRDAGLMFTVIKYFLARTTEVGSRSLLYASQAGLESHGKFCQNCMIDEPSAFVRSEEGKKTQKRVYDEVMAELEKIQPGIGENI
ncbi:MAG: hypothetical protein M1812_006480 [Candelaria pacifica]|nr:MAG: hypothetical protein M1812_006480 [Candelaria pacifica]